MTALRAGANTLDVAQQAVEDLQDCLFGLDYDQILSLASVQKLNLEAVSKFVEIVFENNGKLFKYKIFLKKARCV